MKLSFFTFIFLLLSFNGFSQTQPEQDTSKTTQIVKENKNSQNFNYDADDIYAGRSEVDSIYVINEKEYSETIDEENLYEKRARNEHFLRVFLNVSLLVLWVFSHY
ncbi:MAG: hypothetical protein OEL54_05850, partial [Flavobacteriaceae bacterium]|nr:hypothetical protein [Flavobacteriaceae bacterium]